MTLSKTLGPRAKSSRVGSRGGGGLIYFQGALYTSRGPYILPGGLIYFQEALYTSRRPYILPGGLIYFPSVM
jgi:hypothetical protein